MPRGVFTMRRVIFDAKELQRVWRGFAKDRENKYKMQWGEDVVGN
jgi:hypothetical protein